MHQCTVYGILRYDMPDLACSVIVVLRRTSLPAVVTIVVLCGLELWHICSIGCHCKWCLLFGIQSLRTVRTCVCDSAI